MIARTGFKGIVQNCFQSMGFLRDASMFEFPADMFLPGKDFDRLEQNVDKIVYGLTQWKPTAKERKKREEPKTMMIEGRDYDDALDKMNALFLQNNWGDDPAHP